MTLHDLQTATLPADARARITAAIRTAAPRRRPHARPLALAATLAVLLTAATVTAGAATDWFGLRSRNITHFPTEPGDLVLPQPDAVATLPALAPDAPSLTLTCHGSMTGGDRVYFDLTLTADGASPFAADGKTLTHIELPHAAITFADGHSKTLYCYLLADSTPTRLHFEGSILLSRAEMTYLGQPATLTLGEADLLFAGGEFTILPTDFALAVTLPAASTPIDCAIPPLTLTANGTTITLDRLTLDGTNLILTGHCSATGRIELPDLGPILDAATLTLDDGSTVACGTKNGSGTDADGRFVLNWLMATVVDPTRVTAITLDGVTVPLG